MDERVKDLSPVYRVCKLRNQIVLKGAASCLSSLERATIAMLVKEYRIPLPLSVEEYRIAQLYMITKKTRDESHSAFDGVEIMVNEPYTDGPGGQGQFTRKVFHVARRLPVWIKSFLPKNALLATEESWNAYPYTKTVYSNNMVNKFSLEIETRFQSDSGGQDNVFQLSHDELEERIVGADNRPPASSLLFIDILLRSVKGVYDPDAGHGHLFGDPFLIQSNPAIINKMKSLSVCLEHCAISTVDVIDIVSDEVSGSDYLREEDPRLFRSVKTGRGPLSESWVEQHLDNTKGCEKSLMCVYKLCKVDFRYWGLQTRVERFLQDITLRKTLLIAHRQVWTWQDEWCGMTIEDVRDIERRTADILRQKMGQEDRHTDTV
uniref:Phosphatidylinositol transfer protein N-terminal domain-containing protein n=1 Tax=Timema tahoe TaxID=61484 RepID=A0A7R9FIE6_9NEOP|nr:unnamed protein product [Timema tahoe]